jgi:iron complex outermembrane receptor protein
MAFLRVNRLFPGAAASRRVAVHTPVAQAVAMLLALNSSGAWAQAAPEAPAAERVVVTGTMIRGAAPVGSPVVGVTREEIEKATATTTVDLLRQLPQIANLGASDTHTTTTQNANQNVTVGSGINLRGLGPESTLVLINGRRIAPGGVAGQYTDPSVIPALAVARMEVLTDGASATYGSDAVGGVVNLRLRRNFTGVEGLVRYGEGDGLDQRQLSVLAGKHWDSGSMMVAVDRHERSALSADARAFYTDDLRAWGGPDLRVFNANPGNVLIGTTRYAIPAGQNGVGLARSALVAGTSNKQSITKGISALPEQDRTSAVFSFNQDLTDTVQLTLEGFYSERKFVRQQQAQNGNYTVRNTNPFFVSPTGSTATSVTVNYSFFNDLGTSQSTGFERAYQAAAELNVQLPGKWNASTYVTYSVDQNRNLSPSINNNAVNAALADTNPATALNLFCDGGVFRCNNPDTLAKLPAFNDRNSKYTMVDWAVKADGPVMALPAGQMRAAVGAEVHSDKLPYFLIVNNTTANTSITKYTDNSGGNHERDVKAVFVETYVPLVSAAQKIPGVQRLDLSLAARQEHYSDFGTARNPKLGLSWVPMSGVEVRSTFSKAFRAPTLGDLDPVNGSAVNVVDRVGPDGRTSLHGILYLGGNADGLQPERAKIKTFGLSFRPAGLPGLSTSLDWYDINYQNRILTPGNDLTVLQKPELAPYVNLSPTAAQIDAAKANPVYSGSATEAASGIRYIIDGRRQNAGAVQIRGVDLAARYAARTDLGALTVGLTGSYISRHRQQFTPTTALVDGLLNTLNNPLRFRARAELGWAREGLASVTAFVNHTNAYENKTVTPVAIVNALNTVDVNARLQLGQWMGWSQTKSLYLSFSVTNLFDKQPPYVQNGTLAFDPQNASAIGRFVAVSLGGAW